MNSISLYIPSGPEWQDIDGELYNLMLEYWKNDCQLCGSTYSPEDPQLFWKHEWLKHGTCMEVNEEFDGLTQESFFEFTLGLYESLMENDTINEICGTPTCNAECSKICLDLDFNVIECPSTQTDDDFWIWVVIIAVGVCFAVCSIVTWCCWLSVG